MNSNNLKSLEKAKKDVAKDLMECDAFIFVGITSKYVHAVVVGEHAELVKGLTAEFNHSDMLPKLIQESILGSLMTRANEETEKTISRAKRKPTKKEKIKTIRK